MRNVYTVFDLVAAHIQISTQSSHYENTPIQIYRKIHLQKIENFQIKTLIFFIFLLKT